MAHVIFSSELQRLTREASAEISASNYQQLVTEIESRFPELTAGYLMTLSVAIDGEIVHSPLLEELSPESEVHFLYRISGG